MNRADYEARLQDCFDRRLDPLDDAALQAWLLAHPEALEAFAQQRRLLQAMPAAMPLAAATRRRRWPWLVAAALAAAAWLARPEPATPPPPGRILQASLTEQRAIAGAAFHYSLRQQLLHTDTTRLEIVEQWSLSR